jgi:(2Fe-2S) ferredoxin
MKSRDLSQALTVLLRPMPENFSGTIGVTVCVNERPPTGIVTVSCGPRGGLAIAAAIEAELKRRGIAARFTTIKCLGLCEKGPNVRLTPSNSWFHGVHESDVAAIVDIVEDQRRGRPASEPDPPHLNSP